MLLLLTRKCSNLSDRLMREFDERCVPAFRFNFDLFDWYKFEWTQDGFSFEDPLGRRCESKTVDAMVFHQGRFEIDEPCGIDRDREEAKWVKAWLGALYRAFVRYGTERGLVRLIHPDPASVARPWQLDVARRTFAVPDFRLHFGFRPPAGDVLVEDLAGHAFESGSALSSAIVDRARLDPTYPWFTRSRLIGMRHAVAFFVAGAVHPFRAASSENGRWEPWDAGEGFATQVRTYMADLGLAFGRLDFAIGEGGPWFLSVDPCGRFDEWTDEDQRPLLREVADAILDPANTLSS